MLQGKSLGGAEAGLARGTDKLRDASALLTEHGDATKLEGGRDELAEIIRHFSLFAIPLLVLDFQRSKKMAVRDQVLDISSGEHSMALRVTAGLNQPETGWSW